MARGGRRSVGTPPPGTNDCNLNGLSTGGGSQYACNCVANAFSFCPGVDPCVCMCDYGGGRGFYLQTNTLEAGVSQCVAAPVGAYLVNTSGNATPIDSGFCTPTLVGNGNPCALTDAATFVNSISGLAIHVPIAAILPDAGGISDWTDKTQYVWDFTYLDYFIDIAVQAGLRFSINLAVGFQSLKNLNGTGWPAYLSSLPANFETQCNDASVASTCAPLFHRWNTTCLNNFILMPWHPNIQNFWIQAAKALKKHLKQTPDAGTRYYASLSLIHLPLMSKYDDEIGLPTAAPTYVPPAGSDATCPKDPNGSIGLATQLISESAYQDAYATYGFGTTWGEADLISGMTNIAAAFASEFPDKMLGVTMLNPGGNGSDNHQDVPDFIDDGSVDDAGISHFSNLLFTSFVSAGIPLDRILVQANNLGSVGQSNYYLPEVPGIANQSHLAWSEAVRTRWSRDGRRTTEAATRTSTHIGTQTLWEPNVTGSIAST